MNDIRGAYSARSTEYVELLGSVEVMHPSDRELIGTWGNQVVGAAIDAGCGYRPHAAIVARRVET